MSNIFFEKFGWGQSLGYGDSFEYGAPSPMPINEIDPIESTRAGLHETVATCYGILVNEITRREIEATPAKTDTYEVDALSADKAARPAAGTNSVIAPTEEVVADVKSELLNQPADDAQIIDFAQQAKALARTAAEMEVEKYKIPA